jgi:hypothetical protein
MPFNGTGVGPMHAMLRLYACFVPIQHHDVYTWQ